MRVAFLLYPEVVVSNKSNGIRSQAESWSRCLRGLGHEVVLVNGWENYDWSSFDAIHLFGMGRSGTWMTDVAIRLKPMNSNLFFSPIIDPLPLKMIPLREKMSMFAKTIFSPLASISKRKIAMFKKIFVRSSCERDYLKKYWGLEDSQLALVPLSFSSVYENKKYNDNRADFCLHISSIYQPRKNVVNLIKAAQKYNFELVLAGNPGTNVQFEPIKQAIANCGNIHVLGFVSEEEKLKLYNSARVFALPSIQEGVGIVAVDAAVMGCEIVITNIPGPKDYYNSMAQDVNPYDIDSIGRGVSFFLEKKGASQPQLKHFIENNFSSQRIGQKIIEMYN